MKKRIIQLFEIYDKEATTNSKAMGFIGTTYRKFKIGKEYILSYKRGTNKQYAKEFYIAKCVDILPLQYIFEILNNGD